MEFRLLVYFDIQPFQGCRLTYLSFHGLAPIVIQIKPFQD